jgi:hypothetical protein
MSEPQTPTLESIAKATRCAVVAVGILTQTVEMINTRVDTTHERIKELSGLSFELAGSLKQLAVILEGLSKRVEALEQAAK